MLSRDISSLMISSEMLSRAKARAKEREKVVIRGNKAKQKEDKAWKKVPPKDGDKKSKEVGKYTYNWCEHHMAWCMHKPSECCLGKERKEKQQKTKPIYTANSAMYAAAAALMVDPHFQALLATIGTALQGKDKEE
jgi:hypothetical protein